MELFRSIKNLKGQSLVELLVVISIIGIVTPALIAGFVAARQSRPSESQQLDAVVVMKDTQEAVRSVREKNWNTFAVNGTYYPIQSGSAWSFASGTTSPDGFTRKVDISSVYRDTSGNIVNVGGTLDPSTKKVDYTVSWTTPLPKSLVFTEYLTRFSSNTAPVQTTTADFTLGVGSSATVSTVGGGAVVLDQASSWRAPKYVTSYDITGNGKANDLAVTGNYAIVATSNSATMVTLNISNSTPTLVKNFALGSGTTAFGIALQGNFAYLATGHSSREMQIVNIANMSAPSISAQLDLPGTAKAYTIFVSGSYAYVGKANSTTAEMFIVNIGNNTSPSLAGSMEVGGDVNSIGVSGNTAYLATSKDGEEFMTVNVTTKSAPAKLFSDDVGYYYDNGDMYVDAYGLLAIGATVFVGTDLKGYCSPELNIYNTTTPASPTLVGSYNNGGGISGLFYLGQWIFTALDMYTNSGGYAEQFYVFDISTLNNPIRFGALGLQTGGGGQAVVINGNYGYIATAKTNREIDVVTKTPGAYYQDGLFTSSTIDAGSTVSFNYITFSTLEDNGTNVRVQIAINNDNTTWNYFGPDGTAATYYESDGTIPLSKVSGRYFKYRVYLTSDASGLNTPYFYDFSVNYSP